jgi:hypothetical protein
MCMGIPEGKGINNYRVVPVWLSGPDYFKISGSDRGPDRNILFSTFKNILLGLTKS